MKIFLTKTWSIESARSGYVLKHSKLTNGTGRYIGPTRMTTTNEGYYSTIEEALEKFWEKLPKEEAKDFEGDINEYITVLKNIVNAALKETKGMVKLWRDT